MINTKNYIETSGQSSLRFALAASRVYSELKKRKTRVETILCVPAFSIAFLSNKVPGISFFAQHLDLSKEGNTTGFLVPEIAKMFGATGSILNHSEHRIPFDVVAQSVERFRKVGMKSLVCAKDVREVGEFAMLAPDYIAIEPPELIGSGNAISKAKPEVITESRNAFDKCLPRGSKTVLLCGAGIIDEIDARKAVELGSDGILVASGVVKAKDWSSKILSLGLGLISAREKQIGRR